jgi:multidrug efflux system outer membrane protein
MIDFWGKNRATLYAAEESATAARYNRDVVALTATVDRRQHLFRDS